MRITIALTMTAVAETLLAPDAAPVPEALVRDSLGDIYARRGYEIWAGTDDWAQRAICKGDSRFTQRNLPEKTLVELIDVCKACPVIKRCLLWAEAQVQPVGFAVAGGRRWKAWSHCTLCGKKVRGTDRCGQHMYVGEPIGTICADGTGRPYRILVDDK